MEVSLFCVGFLTFIISDYVFCKISNQPFTINRKNILWSILATVCWVTVEKLFGDGIQTIVANILLVLMFHNLYKRPLSKTILTVLSIYILMMIGETIFALTVVYGFDISANLFKDNALGVFIVNLLTLSMTILFINIKFIRNIFINIIDWYKENKIVKLILFVIVAFGLIAYFTYQNYIGIKSIIYLAEINIILVAIFVFVVGFFKEHAENNKLLVEYDQQMNYVKTYERLANEKSKEQHEYRNQLGLILSMIESKDEKVVSYIDELLEIEKQNKSHQYYEQLTHIPIGGLKGFLLFKINEMKDLGIEVVVSVSGELENEEYWKVCNSELKDISRALGVYLDNAKDASLKANQHFVIIDIVFDEEKLIFMISNTFCGELDFSKFDQDGYSTKGTKHGLALIKDIIEKNYHLSQSRQVNGIFYVQNLIIK